MRYNLIHKLLFVETQLKSIYYFLYAPLLDTVIKGDAQFGVSFSVKNDIRKPENLTQKFDYFWGKKEAKVIYYEHPIFSGIHAKMILDMSNPIYSITVNDAYYKFARYKFENVWPPGLHLADLVTIKLLQNNYLALHGASFFNKKTLEGNLIVAISNTGKSRTTFAAIDKGYGYHSEDITVLDKDSIYTTPLISTQSSMLPNKNLALTYNLFISQNIGMNLIFPRSSNVTNFCDFFRSQDVNGRSKPKSIYILEKGNESIEKLSKDEAFRKMILLNRLELTYSRDHLLLAYAYFNKSLAMDTLYQVERNILQSVIEKAECYLVKSPTADGYIKLIQKTQ